jgi:hypothetical protein
MMAPPWDDPRQRPVAAAGVAEGEPLAPPARPLPAALDDPLPPSGLRAPSSAPPGAGGSMPGRPGPPAAAGQGGPPALPAPPADLAPEPLNLARWPFVNSRPVVRVATLLWLLGLLLLGVNVALFMGYLNDSQESRSTLAGLQRMNERERGDVGALQGRIGSLGLEQQNREVTFLNRQIDERTFSWSLLFDRMAEVLPNEVRLLRLTPSSLVQKDAEAALRAGREARPQPIVLSMSCETKDDEALLRFVDNLFAHPAFAEPNLASEQREDDGLVRFELSVQYLPDPAHRDAGGGAEATAAAGSTGAAARRSKTASGSRGDAAADGAALPAGAGLVRVGPPARAPGGGRLRASRPVRPHPDVPESRRHASGGGAER